MALVSLDFPDPPYNLVPRLHFSGGREKCGLGTRLLSMWPTNLHIDTKVEWDSHPRFYHSASDRKD